MQDKEAEMAREIAAALQTSGTWYSLEESTLQAKSDTDNAFLLLETPIGDGNKTNVYKVVVQFLRTENSDNA